MSITTINLYNKDCYVSVSHWSSDNTDTSPVCLKAQSGKHSWNRGDARGYVVNICQSNNYNFGGSPNQSFLINANSTIILEANGDVVCNAGTIGHLNF